MYPYYEWKCRRKQKGYADDINRHLIINKEMGE